MPPRISTAVFDALKMGDYRIGTNAGLAAEQSHELMAPRRWL